MSRYTRPFQIEGIMKTNCTNLTSKRPYVNADRKEESIIKTVEDCEEVTPLHGHKVFVLYR